MQSRAAIDRTLLFVVAVLLIPLGVAANTYTESSVNFQFVNPSNPTVRLNHRQDYQYLYTPTTSVKLSVPFQFYGTSYNTLYLWFNGAITFQPNLDFALENQNACSGNKCFCTSPSIFPLLGFTGESRLYAKDGEVDYQFYQSCDRHSQSIQNNEPCSIISWEGTHLGGTNLNTYQAILYHSSSDIVLQYSNIANDDYHNLLIGVCPNSHGVNTNDVILVPVPSTLASLDGQAFWIRLKNQAPSGTAAPSQSKTSSSASNMVVSPLNLLFFLLAVLLLIVA